MIIVIIVFAWFTGWILNVLVDIRNLCMLYCYSCNLMMTCSLPLIGWPEGVGLFTELYMHVTHNKWVSLQVRSIWSYLLVKRPHSTSLGTHLQSLGHPLVISDGSGWSLLLLSVPDSLDKSPCLVIISFSSSYLNDYYAGGRALPLLMVHKKWQTALLQYLKIYLSYNRLS